MIEVKQITQNMGGLTHLVNLDDYFVTSVELMALHWYHGISALWGHEGYSAVCKQGGLFGDPLKDAWILEEEGRILATGERSLAVLEGKLEDSSLIRHVSDGRLQEVTGYFVGLKEGNFPRTDLHGSVVIPAFVDPHTHLVWAGDRLSELSMRLSGATYSQIAEAGGGIMASVRLLRASSEEDLMTESYARLQQLMELGVGTVEIKSGYGLDLESEAKSLRVAKALGKACSIPVQATFLGLHAVPPEFIGRAKSYVKTVVNEWLPNLAEQGLVDAVDIFCEQGYFDLEDMEDLACGAQRLNLKVKAHVNQFTSMGGIKAARSLGLLSMDHLEVLTAEDEQCLGTDSPIVVGLPLCSLYLGIPYAPLSRMVQRGQRVALGSDLNPGSAPSGNPWLTWSLACLNCGLEPRMALTSMTVMAAAALGMQDMVGSLYPGLRSDFLTLPQGFQPATAVAGMGVNPVMMTHTGSKGYQS
jgi:imidazolonepropionase